MALSCTLDLPEPFRDARERLRAAQCGLPTIGDVPLGAALSFSTKEHPT
ncbi:MULTISPECIES: hypothetical protein [Burkholderia]|nr:MULTISPECIES: hypothetical protein [Burkholderia]